MNNANASVYGPFPIVPHLSPSLGSKERRRVDLVAHRLLTSDPLLPATDVFGPGVEPGLDDLPTFHIHDVDRPFAGGSVSAREHRALVLARTGDVVAMSRPASTSFLAHCRDDLGLGEVRVLTPSAGIRHRNLALRCLHDSDLCGQLRLLARVHAGLNVAPYIATGGIWALAGVIARLADVPVRVGGPPPRLAYAVNNKVWLAQRVRELLGARALPPTNGATNWATLTYLVSRTARTHGSVGIKLPDASGSAGNLVLEGSRIRALPSLRALREFLKLAFADLGWTEPFPAVVSVWEQSVLDSPSLQMWIPRIHRGPPIVEGVFDQSVVGTVGKFAGCAPTRLGQELQQRIANEGFVLGCLFQKLGYFGRCSLDTILVGQSIADAEIHWVECNGRWGGTSTPMTLANRLAGDWARHPFVVAGNITPAEARDFAAIRRLAQPWLFSADSKRGLMFLAPGPTETGRGTDVMSIGPTIAEARSDVRRFLAIAGSMPQLARELGPAFARPNLPMAACS